MSENKKDLVVPEGAEPGTRERLLKVAIRLFAEKGLEGVTTRDLASEAGVNISLISYYFGGKEGLYRATFENFVNKAKESVSKFIETVNLEELTKERFMAVGQTLISEMIRIKTEDPHMAELMMREELEGLPHSHEIYNQMYSQVAEKIITLFESAQRKGILRTDIHCQTLLHLMAHSADCYLIAQKTETPFTKQCLKFPEQKDLFAAQVMKIFIEGVMV